MSNPDVDITDNSRYIEEACLNCKKTLHFNVQGLFLCKMFLKQIFNSISNFSCDIRIIHRIQVNTVNTV